MKLSKQKSKPFNYTNHGIIKWSRKFTCDVLWSNDYIYPGHTHALVTTWPPTNNELIPHVVESHVVGRRTRGEWQSVKQEQQWRVWWMTCTTTLHHPSGTGMYWKFDSEDMHKGIFHTQSVRLASGIQVGTLVTFQADTPSPSVVKPVWLNLGSIPAVDLNTRVARERVQASLVRVLVPTCLAWSVPGCFSHLVWILSWKCLM